MAVQFPPALSLAAVFVGGMIGGTLRMLWMAFAGDQGYGMAWALLVENVLGAFLLGGLMFLVLEHWRPVRSLHPFLGTGILGSFTTFSGLSLMTADILQRHGTVLAGGYLLLSMLLGLAAAFAGIVLARLVLVRP